MPETTFVCSFVRKRARSDPAAWAGWSCVSVRERCSAEGGDALRQAGDFPRRGVLVENALGDSAGQLRLHFLEGGPGLILVAGGERGLDLLHEGADAADARAVDLRPAIRSEEHTSELQSLMRIS